MDTQSKGYMRDASKAIVLDVFFPNVGGWQDVISQLRANFPSANNHQVKSFDMPKFDKPAGGWHTLDNASKQALIESMFPGIPTIAEKIARYVVAKRNINKSAIGEVIQVKNVTGIQEISTWHLAVGQDVCNALGVKFIDGATGQQLCNAIGVDTAVLNAVSLPVTEKFNADGEVIQVKTNNAIGEVINVKSNAIGEVVQVKEAIGEVIQIKEATGKPDAHELELEAEAHDALHQLVQLVDHDPKAAAAVIKEYGEKPGKDLQEMVEQVVALAQKHGEEFEKKFLADVAKYKGFDIGKIFKAIGKAFKTIGKIFAPIVNAIKKAIAKHKAAKAAGAAPKTPPPPPVKKSNAPAIIVGLLVTIIIGTGFAWALGLFDDKKTATA